MLALAYGNNGNAGEVVDIRGDRGVVESQLCGACERTLPEDSFSEEQRGLRQSSRRCEECVDAGIQLVLMMKGRERSEEDECPICNLLLPLDWEQSIFKACCLEVGVQWLFFSRTQTRYE